MADWQKGDLALCVKDCSIIGVPLGSFNTVREVFEDIGLTSLEIQTGLLFEGKEFPPPYTGVAAKNFRKVTPPKADEFDREVIELMNGQPAEYSGKSPMRTSWWEAVS